MLSLENQSESTSELYILAQDTNCYMETLKCSIKKHIFALHPNKRNSISSRMTRIIKNGTTIGRSLSICIFIIFSLVKSFCIPLISPRVTAKYSLTVSPYPFPLLSTPPSVTLMLSIYSYGIKFQVSLYNLTCCELKIKLKIRLKLILKLKRKLKRKLKHKIKRKLKHKRKRNA